MGGPRRRRARRARAVVAADPDGPVYDTARWALERGLGRARPCTWASAGRSRSWPTSREVYPRGDRAAHRRRGPGHPGARRRTSRCTWASSSGRASPRPCCWRPWPADPPTPNPLRRSRKSGDQAGLRQLPIPPLGAGEDAAAAQQRGDLVGRHRPAPRGSPGRGGSRPRGPGAPAARSRCPRRRPACRGRCRARSIPREQHAGRLARRRRRSTNERSIFSMLDGQPPQVGQRRVAGAEVVEGEPDADRRQLAQRAQRGVEVLDQGGLGDLEGEVPRVEPGLGDEPATVGTSPGRRAARRTGSPPSSAGSRRGTPPATAPAG